MNINNLVELINIIRSKTNRKLTDKDMADIRYAANYLDGCNFLNASIYEETLNTFGKLISRDISSELRSACFDYIDKIRIEANQEGARAKGADMFIAIIGDADKKYNAQAIKNIAICSISNNCFFRFGCCTYNIDLSDVHRLEILCSIIAKAKNDDQIIDIMNCYEQDPTFVNFNTRDIFVGENLNGTKMALNIMKNLDEQGEEIPCRKLEQLANSKSEYIPIEQAIEENIAEKGLKELQKSFPTLNLPFDQYYVRRPKAKKTGKSEKQVQPTEKSMQKKK